MVNTLTNPTRSMSAVGVKPLTSLTEDELVMKQTGESSWRYITSKLMSEFKIKSNLA